MVLVADHDGDSDDPAREHIHRPSHFGSGSASRSASSIESTVKANDVIIFSNSYCL